MPIVYTGRGGYAKEEPHKPSKKRTPRKPKPPGKTIRTPLEVADRFYRRAHAPHKQLGKVVAQRTKKAKALPTDRRVNRQKRALAVQKHLKRMKVKA